MQDLRLYRTELTSSPHFILTWRRQIYFRKMQLVITDSITHKYLPHNKITFFFPECQHLFPSLPLLPIFFDLESCLLGLYVLPRHRGGSGTCAPQMLLQAHMDPWHMRGLPALGKGELGASTHLSMQQMALHYPHPSYLC